MLPAKPESKCLSNSLTFSKESQAISEIIKSFPYSIGANCNVGDCVTVYCSETDQLQRGQILMVLGGGNDNTATEEPSLFPTEFPSMFPSVEPTPDPTESPVYTPEFFFKTLVM